MTLPPAAAATLGGRCACKAAACFSCCAAKSGTSCVRSSIRALNMSCSSVCHRPSVANDRLRHMLIGYTRVSKADGSQSLELQRDALQAAGVDAGHVYHDVASGAGARAMTDSPTRVAEQRWHYGVPGAAVALMAVGGGGDAAPRTGRRARRLLARRNRPEPSGRHPLHRRGLCEPGPGGAVRLRPGRRRRTAPVGGRRRHGRRP